MQSKSDVKNMEPCFGQHYIVELTGCDPEKLKTIHPVKEIFLEAAKISGATILSDRFHQFEPEGVSGVILIAESHFTIHTWPESLYAAIDIFTCGKTMKSYEAIKVMEKLFQADKAYIKSISRGPNQQD